MKQSKSPELIVCMTTASKGSERGWKETCWLVTAAHAPTHTWGWGVLNNRVSMKRTGDRRLNAEEQETTQGDAYENRVYAYERAMQSLVIVVGWMGVVSMRGDR
jgi:hypothetical protein